MGHRCRRILVSESGGTVTDTEGQPFSLSTRNILATNGHLHEELMNELRV